MKPSRIYLDWNASAPLLTEARAAMVDALEATGNPSSIHAEGRAARAQLETAREQVAALVGAKPAEVIFTSGATEANAMMLAGRPWGGFACSVMEHPSVLSAVPANVPSPVLIEASRDGRSAIGETLMEHLVTAAHLGGPLLVSHQLANGETGVIHDVRRLAELVRLHRSDAVIHTDAAQAAGRIAIDMGELGVDAITLSSHKLGGPIGAGALVVRDGVQLSPLLRGGGQERGRRAGTENVAAIAGFGAAAEVARRTLDRAADHMVSLRDRLEAGLMAATPGAVIVGQASPRLPNTMCVSLSGRRAEFLVMALDLAGIAISAGSACSSGKVAASAVLAAMGLPEAIQQSAVRISVGISTTTEEIEAFLTTWKTIAGGHRAAA